MHLTQRPAPRRSASRGGYAVGDERRARILDVAVEHFAQWGFHASSLARIAKEVGITQGGLLHHFRGKEDLLVSVLEHSDEQDRQRFFSRAPGSAAELFEVLVELATHNSVRPGRTKMFNMLAAEAGDPGHPAHEYFVSRYRTVIDYSLGPLRAAVERGEIAPGTDCEDVAVEVAAVMDGLQLQWALAPDTFDMPGRLRTYLDRLLRSLTTDVTGVPTPR